MKRKRFVKKMTSWIRGGGILLLSNISLVSVGFASWTIGASGVGATGDIIVTTSNLIDLSKYFVFNENEKTIDNANAHMQPTKFSYNDYGVVKNNIVQDTGDFSFYMACLLRGDDGLISKDTTLSSFSFSYKFTDKGDFALLPYLSKVSYVITNESGTRVTASSSLTKDGNDIVSQIDCTESTLLSSSRIFYYVSMNFDFSSVDDFKATIADNLSKSDVSISVIYEVPNE